MNPYESLPPEAFWRTAVANKRTLDISGLANFRTKLSRSEVIATAGSCFAQHIAKRLRLSGFNYLDVEPAPDWLPANKRAEYGYELFSARYGNVYSSTQMKQLVMRAFGKFTPAETVWHSDGRYFDPFRPSIEPGGFASEEEALHSQASHLRAVGAMFKKIDVMVFTLGLTETWRSKEDHAAYPACPGVQGGTFDPDRHEFVNLDYATILSDMRFVIDRLTRLRPHLRFILTVSPVPLTATASGNHVLTATMHSKSILRAVAGKLRELYPNVDYFPSYEIINSPVFGGQFFEANLRSVRPEGVDFVMGSFLRECCLEGDATSPQPVAEVDDDDVLCDQEILEFYAQ